MTSTFGNVISAFSEEQVERLTGLTKFRLRYWDRTDFFTPSLAEENRRLAYSRVYSFRDLASLRVLSVLLNQYNVSLQHLRQVSRKLTHLAENKWTGTTLYVLKRKVLFVEPGEETPREIVSGQYALGIPLEKVLADTKRDVVGIHTRLAHSKGKVERNRLVAHNEWVVAGTRIPVQAIRDFHDAGYNTKQIIAEYPDLTPQDIKVALAHKIRNAA
jgi:uncharacterized protein (DUF433 family)